MNYSISTKDLQKQYPGAESKALDGLTFSFEKGIIAGLLGPNGAGKTTTISILCGLLMQTGGTAEILGLDTRKNIVEIKNKIGVVPQQIALYPQLSAQENLEYIGRLYQLPSKQLKQRIKDLLEAFGLKDNAKKRIIRYSGGMKRRANIIAGLLHDPEILILDEPTAGVDVQSRAMILNFLKEYNQRGKTIVYTSHHLEEAEKICDQVAIVDSGKLIAQDTPSNLIRNTSGCTTLEDVFLTYTGRNVRE